MTRTNFFIITACTLFALSSCRQPDVTPAYHQPTTYANPINIDYTYSIVNTHEGQSYRSGADPAVVPFRDKYYMFVTRSQGYWMSDDLKSWDFVRPQNWFFPSSNAPGAWPMSDSLLIALASPDGWQNVIFTDDPETGTWQGSSSLLTTLAPIHDPALFVDDDGRVFAYGGSSNVYPIWGAELNPNHYFLAETEKLELIELHPDQHGWERFGENHKGSDIDPFIEGPWMTKYNGTYYLEYAAPGTEWNVYADGVYTSDNPLGPFTYEEYSPFSYKPGGFIRGAGHGSTVQDPWGNYWRYTTMVKGIIFDFERRIGKFPSGFDEDGQLWANTAYGDYPHYLPSDEERGREDWFTGWMLLSYQKPVNASSHHEDFVPEHVVDEEIKSYWVAGSGDEGEWITIDLEAESTVKAIQINYTDYESNIFGKPDTLYHQYLIESSLDGENWDILVDKRSNDKDVPNDYVELPIPADARFVRFTNYHVPTPNLAISGLRIFGLGSGNPPHPVDNFMVERQDDRRDAILSWDHVEDSQGYHFYYGIHPEKLYNSIMVYGETSYELRALNVNPDYYFQIEAFNENGISERSDVIKAE
jgi:xylan 1,4-beta-xylosidase